VYSLSTATFKCTRERVLKNRYSSKTKVRGFKNPYTNNTRVRVLYEYDYEYCIRVLSITGRVLINPYVVRKQTGSETL